LTPVSSTGGFTPTARERLSAISPLHRWIVEWKLQAKYSAPALAITTGNILTFIIDVIRKFSPKQLATERKLPSGEIQYQDEFYRGCSSYADCSVMTFPEYGTG